MLKKFLLSIVFLFFLSSLSYGKSPRISIEIGSIRAKKSKTSSGKKAKKVFKDHLKVQSKKRTKKQRVMLEPNMETILKRQEQKRIQREVVAAQQRQQQSETIRRAQEFLVKNNHTYQDKNIMNLFKIFYYRQNKNIQKIETRFYQTLDLLTGNFALQAIGKKI